MHNNFDFLEPFGTFFHGKIIKWKSENIKIRKNDNVKENDKLKKNNNLSKEVKKESICTKNAKCILFLKSENFQKKK